MVNVYSKDFINPITKIYYNLIITCISCTFALFIGIIGLFGIIQPYYSDDNTGNLFWQFIIVTGDKENFLFIGVSLLGSFLLGYFISFILYKSGNFQNTINLINSFEMKKIESNTESKQEETICV